jgi:hypothetical protein
MLGGRVGSGLCVPRPPGMGVASLVDGLQRTVLCTILCRCAVWGRGRKVEVFYGR